MLKSANKNMKRLLRPLKSHNSPKIKLISPYNGKPTLLNDIYNNDFAMPCPGPIDISKVYKTLELNKHVQQLVYDKIKKRTQPPLS